MARVRGRETPRRKAGHVHRLELKALDMSYVEDTDFARITNYTAFLASHDRNVSLCQNALGCFDERVDQVVAVNEHSN